MSEKQETVEQAVQRLGFRYRMSGDFLLFQGGEAAPRAIRLIQSLEAKVAKLEAERDEAVGLLAEIVGDGEVTPMWWCVECAMETDATCEERCSRCGSDFASTEEATVAVEAARRLVAKHQGGGDE